MCDDPNPIMLDTASRRSNSGALLLAVGGLVAAFGAASCCALPLLLASLGLSSAWLVAVAWLAAPHRIPLLIAAFACVAAGGGLLWRRYHATACAPDGCRGRQSFIAAIGTGILSVA